MCVTIDNLSQNKTHLNTLNIGLNDLNSNFNIGLGVGVS